MKPSPAIYEVTQEKTGKRLAWLVDEHSAFLMPDETGTPRQHFGAAIELGELKAGDLTILLQDSGERLILGPRCCLLMVEGIAKKNNLKSREFRRDAAEVLLRLAAAANHIKADYLMEKWDFHGPAKQNAPTVWNEFSFLAAWRFSDWMKRGLNQTQQFADMVTLGYPSKPGTFRQMMRKMKLSPKKKENKPFMSE